MTDLQPMNESLFEDIKHINEYGQEYWSAREQQIERAQKKRLKDAKGKKQ